MQRLVTIPLRAVGRPGEVLWKGGWPIAIQRPLSSFLNGFEIVVEALFTNEPVACCGEGKPIERVGCVPCCSIAHLAAISSSSSSPSSTTGDLCCWSCGRCLSPSEPHPHLREPDWSHRHD